MDPKYGYVTDEVSQRFFEGLLAMVEAFVDMEVRYQSYAERDRDDPFAVGRLGNNGAEYLDEIRDLCEQALGNGEYAP